MAVAGSISVANADYAMDPGVPLSPKGRTHTISWTCDASGNVSGTTFSTVGQIMRATFAPGTPAPTNLYDVTLLDANGIDVLGGGGANQSNTTAATTVPSIVGSGGTTFLPIYVAGTLELQVANGGNAKQGSVVVYVK